MHPPRLSAIVGVNVKLSLQWKWFLGLAALLAALLLLIITCIDLTLPPYLVRRIQHDLEREARLTREVFGDRDRKSVV